MLTLRSWLEKGTAQRPQVLRRLEARYRDLLDREVTVGPDAEYPWNTIWSNESNAPSWLLTLLGGPDALVEDWLQHDAILPSSDERIVCQLATQFKSGAAWVFLLHGNVHDYLFDAHLGFAPLPDVLESYWIDSQLFSGEGPRPEAAVLRYSVSDGVRLQRLAGAASLKDAVRQHRDQIERLPSHEARISHDFTFLRRLIEEDRLRPDDEGQSPPPLLVYFERPALLFPPGSDQLRTAHWVEHLLRWAQQVPPHPHHLVVLAADAVEDLNPELRKRVNGIIQIELPRPSAAVDRSRFLAACLAACGKIPVPMPCTRLRQRTKEYLPLGAEHLRQLAEATAGLNCTGIETCVLNILEREIESADEALRFIKEERGRLLHAESEGLLQIIEPTKGLDALVGGLEAVRERLRWVVDAMQAPLDSPNRKRMPMGLLFVGPPGTGKSLMAQALAKELDGRVHYVKMGDFRDMWVGQSERNFSRLLRLLEAFGQVIVFMDEIDQTEGGSRARGERHETSRRIFGKLLEFMADERHRGRILWIAATNRPDGLDAAMLRPGRFDFILPFEPPDSAGCRQILELHLLEEQHDDDVRSRLDELGGAMARRSFTGAEIQFVVREAARRAAGSGRPMGADHIAFVLEDYVGAQKDAADYREMIEQCRRFIPFKSLRRPPQ